MEEQSQIEEIFHYYDDMVKPADQETAVNLLREIQEVQGFISPELRKRAAETLGVKEAVLICLIRRFPSLKEADYRHTVTVCSGERCGRKQGMEILRAVKRELKIEEKAVPVSGQMLSGDGSVLLRTQNCLKQCRTSPNLMIDGKVYRQVKPEDVPGLLTF